MKIEIAKQQDTVVNSNALIPMTVILLLAFALGAHGLNLDPIWADELSSVTSLGAFNPPYGPAQVVSSVHQHSPDHVPLYFIIGAYWARLVGWSQFALRAFSLLAGALTIAWLYRFAADLVDRRTALVAALLLSTSAFIILYFHDIRMYTMLMSLGIMHTWFYWRLAHGSQVTRMTWLMLVVSTTMLLYTHYFAATLFVGLGIYHLLLVRQSMRWGKVIMAWGLGAALFLPYAPLRFGWIRFSAGCDQRLHSDL